MANYWSFLQEELSKHVVSKALTKNISGDSAHLWHLVYSTWLLLLKGRCVGMMGASLRREAGFLILLLLLTNMVLLLDESF